jgi:RimJ/RimL family protein N-acetyltransferase
MDLQTLIAAAPDLRLESERLVLRRLVDGDVATALAHEQDRRIMRWIRDPQPVDMMRERIEAMQQVWTGTDGEWLTLVIAAKERPLMLGIVVCRVTVAANETIELGYRLHPDVHRRGFAFEACARLLDHLFAEVHAHKVIALCVVENEASWRLMEKLGMQREAHLRQHSRLAGQWRDEFVYGLLAREWSARFRPQP